MSVSYILWVMFVTIPYSPLAKPVCNYFFQDKDVEEKNPESALHRAVRERNIGAVEALLKAGQDPNGLNFYKYTPLHVAAAFGPLRVAKILVAAGSKVTMKNYNDETPRDIAIRCKNNRIAQFLKAEEEKIKSENYESTCSLPPSSSENVSPL